ncbi:hypothetical protein AB0I34_06895 [Kribbella sp. NPDC050281]|uniref:hypothetical protein n=1 Tax=Kribbella sp. NPDC050281 TaxID=3155515 RepID=UPI0033D4BBAA
MPPDNDEGRPAQADRTTSRSDDEKLNDTVTPDTPGWRAEIARTLADAPDPTVPRSELRDAMPEAGSIRTSGGGGGKRSASWLADMLNAWEGFGWIRRNTDDTVTVLDPAALRHLADHDERRGTSSRPADVIALELAGAVAAGDTESTDRLTVELRTAEDHDPQQLTAWIRAIRRRNATRNGTRNGGG